MKKLKTLLTFIALVLTIMFFGSSRPAEKIKVYMIGDSTMSDKNPDVYPETGWGQVLPSLFDKDVVIINRALNGRSTKSFIDQGLWKAVYDSLKPGNYVFIQFGHNDEHQYDSLTYADPATTYRKNLENFINETNSKGAIPVLFTPIVRRSFNESGVLNNTHKQYPDAVREVAKETRVLFVDLEVKTKELLTSYGVEGSKKLFVFIKPGQYVKYPDGREDNTHLSEFGAREIAKLAAAEISKLPVPVAKHIKLH
jgi:lysophospholipase L1-like esterase